MGDIGGGVNLGTYTGEREPLSGFWNVSSVEKIYGLERGEVVGPPPPLYSALARALPE